MPSAVPAPKCTFACRSWQNNTSPKVVAPNNAFGEGNREERPSNWLPANSFLLKRSLAFPATSLLLCPVYHIAAPGTSARWAIFYCPGGQSLALSANTSHCVLVLNGQPLWDSSFSLVLLATSASWRRIRCIPTLQGERPEHPAPGACGSARCPGTFSSPDWERARFQQSDVIVIRPTHPFHPHRPPSSQPSPASSFLLNRGKDVPTF